MAVILEAYLLGCGRAMIESFSQQVRAVTALQEVAQMIKILYPEGTDLPSTGGEHLNHINHLFFSLSEVLFVTFVLSGCLGGGCLVQK